MTDASPKTRSVLDYVLLVIPWKNIQDGTNGVMDITLMMVRHSICGSGTLGDRHISVAMGDYNNDRYLDILMAISVNLTGDNNDYQPHTYKVTWKLVLLILNCLKVVSRSVEKTITPTMESSNVHSIACEAW